MSLTDIRNFVVKPATYRWFLGLLLAGYAYFIGANFAPVAAGADSGGYMASARLLTEGKLTEEVRRVPGFAPPDNWAYTPLGYQDTRGDGTFRPTYPIGLPLHYALGGMIAGWHWGVLAVGVLAAVAAVAFCYLCARELGVGRPLALAGTTALAVSPVFLFPGFIPMSDVPATAWGTAAFYFGLRARRGAGWWALATGAAFALAVLVRPSHLIFLPVLLLLVVNWRNIVWLGLGGLPGALLNAWYNHAQYGKVTTSGYGSIFDIFRSEFVALSLKNYAATLPQALPILFLALVAVFFLPWKTRGWVVASLVVWALLFPAFYMFYEFTHYTWWYLRFIIPSFPAIVLLAVWGAELGLARWPSAYRRWAIGGLAVMVGVVSCGTAVALGREHHLLLLKPYQKPYVAVTSWSRENLPGNAVILSMQASSCFYFYTDFPIVRWDAVDPSTVTNLHEALARSGRPLYAALFPFEEKDAMEKRVPGRWTKVADLVDVGVWRYDP